jgi:hypothetical protein
MKIRICAGANSNTYMPMFTLTNRFRQVSVYKSNKDLLYKWKKERPWIKFLIKTDGSGHLK